MSHTVSANACDARPFPSIYVERRSTQVRPVGDESTISRTVCGYRLLVAVGFDTQRRQVFNVYTRFGLLCVLYVHGWLLLCGDLLDVVGNKAVCELHAADLLARQLLLDGRFRLPGHEFGGDSLSDSVIGSIAVVPGGPLVGFVSAFGSGVIAAGLLVVSGRRFDGPPRRRFGPAMRRNGFQVPLSRIRGWRYGCVPLRVPMIPRQLSVLRHPFPP